MNLYLNYYREKMNPDGDTEPIGHGNWNLKI